MTRVRRGLRLSIEWLDRLVESSFGPRLNPLKHLGALGWFCYWIVAVTGVYLFAFFDTGIVNAYDSVEAITHEQRYAGGVMRSLHRYASDALIVVMLVHMLRTWASGEYRGARWFSWVSGVPIIWFVYASGITGYWLVWDKLAQYVAITTAQWLDALGIFGESIARNFLNEAVLSSRFFTLMAFIHIAVPLLLLFLMWLHLNRQAQPRVNPPRTLAALTLTALVVLSLVFPAQSQGRADLDVAISSIGLDWFYLNVYPLLDYVDGLVVWGALVGVSVLLTLVPWAPPRPRPIPAVVHLDACNGCNRCVADCPFMAVSLIARTDGKPFEQEAQVDAALCTGCGLCMGACPTATPFRSVEAPQPGIEIPTLTIAALRDATERRLAALGAGPKVAVFRCAKSATIDDATVADIELPCVGALPPSFIDYALHRLHADGVALAGCGDGACHYRLGQTITEGRIRRTRDPRLRQRVDDTRVVTLWESASRRRVGAQLAKFRSRLAAVAAQDDPR